MEGTFYPFFSCVSEITSQGFQMFCTWGSTCKELHCAVLTPLWDIFLIHHLRKKLTFKRQIKSHLPFAGIIRSSPYSPRFHNKG